MGRSSGSGATGLLVGSLIAAWVGGPLAGYGWGVFDVVLDLSDSGAIKGGGAYPFAFAAQVVGAVLLLVSFLLAVGAAVSNRGAQRDPSLPAREIAPPAHGWYPEPAGTSKLRYWDGTRWTDHVHPPPDSGP